jgi:hyperosmotically inducible protein
MKTRRVLLSFTLAASMLAPVATATIGCGKTVGETIDDATITTRVKTALLNDPDVGGLRIDVDTTMGVVTLNGVVKSKAEETKAIAVARKIDGVKDVKSTLQVNPGN